MPPAAEVFQAHTNGQTKPASVGPPLDQGPAKVPDATPKYTKTLSAVSHLDVSFSFNSDSNPSPDLPTPLDSAAPDSSAEVLAGAQTNQRRPSTWQLQASDLSLRTVNPIRKITDAATPATLCSVDPSRPKKSTISLGAGDPTVFGHLTAAQEAVEAVAEAVLSGKFNGYSPSFGLSQAREAVAKYLTAAHGPHASFSPGDVYITSGCGPSFQLCLEALANPGKNVLLPRPGFPVYDCWCAAAGLEIRRYSLLPEENWEVDLAEVQELADENTVALLLCHPGNPCGNVFRQEHLREILLLAESLKLPIISDEIYGGIAFFGTEFTPTAAVAGAVRNSRSTEAPVVTESLQNGHQIPHTGAVEQMQQSMPAGQGCTVPVLTISAISKTLLVPGWRLGWIAVHDPLGVLKASRVLEALENRMQFAPPTCTLIQAALPRILSALKPEYFRGLNSTLKRALEVSLEKIAKIPGLECPSHPQGGMFLMVRINLAAFPEYSTDMEWCRALLAEESVVVIPGTAFEFPGWLRTLISAPVDVLQEAWARISDFCARHSRN